MSNRAIITICNKGYEALLPLWVDRMLSLTKTPIYILLLDSDITKFRDAECNYVYVWNEWNPFPKGWPDHACAEKLRIFQHIPSDINEVLFLDLDILLINNFWDKSNYFSLSETNFIACLDLFVGYKEKMEAEFWEFDPGFKMKYLPDGNYHYFNTGVFFANRNTHFGLFATFLSDWEKYVQLTWHFPSIFDQNMINYCLIRYEIQTIALPLQNNCLRQYEKSFENNIYIMNGLPINALHFNGWTAELKVSRWHEALVSLGVTLE